MDLYDACQRNDIDKVKELLASGVDPIVDNNYAIKWACYYGHTNTVELLLQDRRADPTVADNYALRQACAYGHTDVVHLLLQDRRVDPTDANNWAIGVASGNGHTNVVKVLLQDGRVDPTDNNEWAICYAATNKIRDMLIAYKYRVDGPEYNKSKEQFKNVHF